MQITNNHNLPETLFRSIQNDTYTRGDSDYSATDLLNPIRVTILTRRHESEIVEDAVDRIWSTLGSIGHSVVERAGGDDSLIEERLFLNIGGRTISGAMDHFKDGKISDYKFTSIFVGKDKSKRVPEWEAQQNIYAWLLERHGFGVDAVEVCLVYRDWRPGEAKREPDYPPRAEVVPLKLWSVDKQEHFIRNRLQILIFNEGIADDELPLCTTEEMWEKPTIYAVMKDGAKRSTKNFDNKVDAQVFASSKMGLSDKNKMEKYIVDARPGRRIRCEEYCSVNRFCNQYQDYVKNNGNGKGEL